ncbi:MAG TPA: aminopeptidase P family protein [Xanthobacteraceae bacterium]|nr:aminopeptidase P family protein [Xanthobacteraceae bacterium]
MFKAEFQSFEERATPGKGAERLNALRKELARRGLDGFIVTTADQHQNEYVPACEERMAWLTGFTGSLGAVVVLGDKAALFVDGRYTLQARDQVDGKAFSIEHLVEHPPHEWIAEHLSRGAKLGFDSWRTTLDSAERLQKSVERAGGMLVAASDNPLDAIWRDRPAPPLTPVKLHDLKFAGEPAAAKLKRIREALAKDKLDAVLLSDPASIAWTFNIRGHDVSHTPLPLSWAFVPREGEALLFVDARKLSNEVRDTLAKLADIREPAALEDEVTKRANGKTVRLDQATAPKILAKRLEAAGGKIDKGADPVMRMKAVKNAAEIDGARAAHLRDGAALVRFLAWFDHEAPQGNLTEIDAVAALETFRRETGKLKDISFPTISGAGPNGAIVHYRVTDRSNRRIAPGELFLLDSGAQYEDGTTDVTRTVAVGEPTSEMRTRFTQVLKGHIAIATAKFPQGTTGAQIDPFARRALWADGVDFDHGTGHGVGSYLSVHEGPARISKLGGAKLEAGMILSNEPGYYKTGAYGIRIENLELIVGLPAPSGGEKKLLGFEVLTLAPIDRRLIDPSLLTADEIDWVNAYHADVRRRLSPELDDATARWLKVATDPLPK